MSVVEFQFRVWLYASDDPPEVEVWVQELEPCDDTGKRAGSEWALEHLSNYSHSDFLDLFSELDLDQTLNWQVIGTGWLSGRFCPFGEWDEDIEVDGLRCEEFVER